MRLVPTLLLTVAVAATTAYFVSSGKNDHHQETAFERVLNSGTIRCGYYTWPGLIEKNVTTGKMEGIFTEIMPALTSTLGLKVEWTEEVSNDQMMDGLATGRYDAICAPIVELPNRAKSGLMTQPLFYWPTYAYARAGDKRFDNNYGRLNRPDVRFAALDGEFSELFARQAFPLAQIVSVPALSGISQAIMSMVSGRADVVLTEPFTGDGYMANNPGKIKQISGPPVYVAPLVFAVGPNEWQLQQFINVGIRGLQDQGIITSLVNGSPAIKNYAILMNKPYRETK
jgi:ABC-type amino acid transport substrate-binding protein